ncbi:MAG: GDP-mannose 4,6-dehydratase [Geobacteraceae bacterium]|nr:GDP-mannose 4,6-dehydratase [Geobacteraceae bacterium]
MEVDSNYFRPAEVELLLGDPTKARTKMGWKTRTDLDGLVAMMTDSDLDLAEREKRANG